MAQNSDQFGRSANFPGLFIFCLDIQKMLALEPDELAVGICRSHWTGCRRAGQKMASSNWL